VSYPDLMLWFWEINSSRLRVPISDKQCVGCRLQIGVPCENTFIDGALVFNELNLTYIVRTVPQ